MTANPDKPIKRNIIVIVSVIAVAIAGIVVVLSMSTPSNITLNTNEDTPDVNIFPIDSKPYGAGYDQWATRWWQWVLSIPEEDAPALDETGEKCEIKQDDPNVWFLISTYGGEVERKCTVPAGKAYFFPLINIACDNVSFPNLKTEEELRQCALEDQKYVYQKKLVVDGVEVKDLDKYFVVSSTFDVVLPENNVHGMPAGTRITAVTAGYYVMLEPLTPGKHTINFGGASGDPASTTIENFAVDVTYNITVE